MSLQLVLRTPFWFDDAANANLSGYLRDTNQTFSGYIHSSIGAQWHYMGRFTPLGLLENYGLMDTVHDRLAYKAFLVVMTIVAALAVARVLMALRVPTEIALLAAALTSALYQIHLYHDVLYAYSALIQCVVVLFCGSLLLFVGWLRQGGWWRLALALALVVAADLFYEAAYLLVVLHVAVVIAERQPWRKAMAPVAISVVFVGVTAYLRLKYSSSGSYSANLAPDKVVPAFLKQLSATLPGSSFWSHDGPRILPSSHARTPMLRGALIGLLSLPLLWAAATQARGWRPERRQVVAVAIVAVALITLPAALVSLAVRYQNDLRWGAGYLPVFGGVVGVAVLATLAYAAAARRLPVAALATVCAVLVGVSAARNAEGGTRIVSSLEKVAAQRDDLDDAVRHGLLAGASTHDVLFFDQRQIAPPEGFWLPSYGMTMKQWFETASPKTIQASYELYPDDATDRFCPLPGADEQQQCKVLGHRNAWFSTGVVDGRRWVLLTPFAPGRPKRHANLFYVKAARTARLVIEDGGEAPLAGLGAQWATRVGAPVAGAAAPRITRRSGRWTFADVAVPSTATAGTGFVTAQAST
ncbi:hypothetical protein [Baekduia alba]|uniref:hypothetical protein n=1 Tax=Baekduia alba TaxID=2997333 RepID=UPI002342594F|nr:hypothetical protein [Baekduia alba]